MGKKFVFLMKKNIAQLLVFLLILNSMAFGMPIETVRAASHAENLVAVAKSQIGVKERSNNSDDVLYNDWYYGERVNNNGQAAKYAWCAVFVSWCANQAGISTSIIPKHANVDVMKNKLQQLGASIHLKGSGYTPQCGDIIFFGTSADLNHVGIVEYSAQGKVYYIDGNNTNTNPHGVHYSNCSLSYSKLWGFATPNYANGPSPEPVNHAPEGSADGSVGGLGSITVSGWAFDRDDISKAVAVHVYIGGTSDSGAPGYEIMANKERTDVGSVYGTGNYHGFYETINTDLVGTQTLYFYAIGIGGGGNTFLGTRTVTIKRPPVGNVDWAEGGLRKIEIGGWAYDPEKPDSPIAVHVYVGGPAGSGVPGYQFTANEPREDVGNAHGVGNNHGFSGTIETDLYGEQTLYFYAMDANDQGFASLGTQTVNISAGQSPVGMVDWAEGRTDSITVGGWAYDPDNQGQTAYIHVYAGGPAGAGSLLAEIAADKEREDVGAGGLGNYHGFSEEIATNLTGNQTLYFYAIDTNGNMHSLIGTNEVIIRQGKSPVGHLDSVLGEEGSVSVCGWTIDEDALEQPVSVHVYIGGPAGSGAPGYEITADEDRPDLKNAFQGAGTEHGFTKTITTGKRGEQEVYIYAIDAGSRRDNTLLGHGTVTIRDPQPVQEHVHQYQEETAREATCTREGEKWYICSCGDSYTEKIEKIPHTVVIEAARPATCTASGRTEGSRCSVCDMVLKAQEIVEKTGHGHTVVRYAREATCMSAGYTGDTFCEDCGMKVAEGTETELLGHSWDSGVTLAEPTATEEGICVFTCTKCGITRIKKLPATGIANPDGTEEHAHRYAEEIVQSATCTKNGEKKFSCSCGAFYTEIIESLGHDWDGGIVTKEPTDEEEGLKIYTCRRCDSTRETVVPKTGGSEPHIHQYEPETIRFATCTKDGEKQYVCACGDSYVEPIERLGHDWDGGVTTKEPTEEEEGLKIYTCTRCDSTRETIVPKTGEKDPDGEEPHVHQYVEEIMKLATCIRDGEKKYVCVCKDSYTEKIERLGHDWDDGVIEEEATDTDDGLIIYTCARCGSTSEKVIPNTGSGNSHTHVYEETDRNAATCEEDGEIWYACSCGDSYEEDIPATGHKWDEGIITKEATATETGIRTFTCAICELTKEEVVPIINLAQQEGTEDAQPLSEGDIVYDEQHTAEYEVVWVKGGETGVEYAELLNKKDSTVKIPNTIETEEGIECKVVSIAKDAFRNNKKIRKVSIGKNVTSIGSKAFSGCSNLSSLTLGQNVTEIGNNAFSGCGKLKTLTLPKKVTKIGANAFYNCKKLKTLIIKTKKLTSGSLAKKAFKGVPEKASVKVPKGKSKSYKKLLRQKGLPSKVKIS